jgi:hypothetical protein
VKWSATGFLLAWSVVAGCGAPVFREVPEGKVATPGVTITAASGAFELRAGQPFRPPFFARDCLVTATAENYPAARQMGAQPVRVTVPGRDQPLHGLLALCRVHPDATGPATRQYLIRVPQSYIDATSGGRVSVLFEETNIGGNYSDGHHSYDAWQLWLSEGPFMQ